VRHCRLSVTYAPGVASIFCTAPLTRTVKPSCTQAGTRSLTSSAPLPVIVRVAAPSSG
jgi:hypothetical protein